MRIFLRVMIYLVLVGGTVFCASRFGSEFSATTADETDADKSVMMTWFGGFLACALMLGIRTALDVGRFVGSRAERHILVGEESSSQPEVVKEAEELLKRRQPLDAISILRDHLKEHPGDHDIQFRIAEIYGETLKNQLAAALEYEDLLTHKLDAERWGWTAIRLSHLYVKLREYDKRQALLERVVDEFGKTSAARKAEKLLASFD